MTFNQTNITATFAAFLLTAGMWASTVTTPATTYASAAVAVAPVVA
ncbi:hypothetical protein [Croceicoccus gelatinilyticus]|nr:hypothetical protein [Croceicoccus gelatinilyticus]MBS7671209.1 hypothetical protein [Croceicoccus gelatinilyticus]